MRDARRARRWLAALLAAGAGCAGGEARDPQARRERRIDLLPRMSAAQREPATSAAPELIGDWEVSRDDERLEVLAPAGCALTLQAAPLHPGARLFWRAGPSKLDGAMEQATAATLERVAATGGRERLLALEWPAGDRTVHEGELDLSRRAGEPLVLRVETHAAGGDASRVAWSGLELRSEGRPRDGRDDVLVWDDLALDLAQAVAGGAGRDGAITLPIPGACEMRVQVPAGARLRAFGAASLLDREPVALRVAVDGEPRHEQRHGAGRDESRRFDRGFEVDLAALAGREVVLRFEAEAVRGAADPASRASFVLPRIIAPRTTLRQRRAPGRPDVFLIVVDTLRADALSCYGAARGATPRLDALAAQGLLFERAYAPSPWTLPSTASLLTGLEPDEHGVALVPYLPRLHPTIAERFAAAGVTTGAFVANTLLSRDANFDQGFETFVDLAWGNARKGVPRLLDWVDEHEGERLFAWLHLIDPHAPYDAPLPPERRIATAPDNPFRAATCEEIVRRFGGPQRRLNDIVKEGLTDEMRAAVARMRDLYEEEVRYVDRQIGELLDGLRARGRLDGAIVAVTADHGEEFLEHGGLFHGDHLYDESVRVPLIVVAPGLAPGRVEEPYSCVALAAALARLAGLDAQPSAGALTGEAPETIVLSTELATELGSDVPLRREGLVRGPLKLIATPESERVELYDLATDRGERSDLSLRQAGLAEALLRLLHEQRDAARARSPFAGSDVLPDRMDELRRLGYVK